MSSIELRLAEQRGRREERIENRTHAFRALRNIAAFLRRSEVYAAHLEAKGESMAAMHFRREVNMVRRVTRTTIGSDKA